MHGLGYVETGNGNICKSYIKTWGINKIKKVKWLKESIFQPFFIYKYNLFLVKFRSSSIFFNFILLTYNIEKSLKIIVSSL